MNSVVRDAEKTTKKRRGQEKETAIRAVEILEKSWSGWRTQCVVKCRSQACKGKWGPYAEHYSSDEQTHVQKIS